MSLALSIDQMKHLKELGVDISKASMWWCRIVRPACPPTKKEKVMVDWFLSLQKEHMHTGLDVVETIPTFILDDILNLLPGIIYSADDGEEEFWFEFGVGEPDKSIWYVQYRSVTTNYTYKYIQSNNLIDAAYKMLCWVAENNYLNTNSN